MTTTNDRGKTMSNEIKRYRESIETDVQYLKSHGYSDVQVQDAFIGDLARGRHGIHTDEEMPETQRQVWVEWLVENGMTEQATTEAVNRETAAQQ